MLPRHILRPPRQRVNGASSRLERMYHHRPGGRPVDNPDRPVHEQVDNTAERVDERLPSVDEHDSCVDGRNHHM